jgi:hypothetical protein
MDVLGKAVGGWSYHERNSTVILGQISNWDEFGDIHVMSMLQHDTSSLA